MRPIVPWTAVVLAALASVSSTAGLFKLVNAMNEAAMVAFRRPYRRLPGRFGDPGPWAVPGRAAQGWTGRGIAFCAMP
jgi:hypothetical protein